MVTEADYCGIVSGQETNKAEVCRFTNFYGKLGNAPMIEQCPVNLECKVVHTLGLGSHLLLIGRVEETYITEECLTDGKPDVAKIKPIIYSEGLARQYQAFGDVIASAYLVGRKLKDRQ
jgi:flavin reductase (DIM6/NTAB) family NADH-FMN oxidoreductase RutF